ncbi:tRNA lysidine(34) synthetase TilS [Streptobacillus moniliformis]|uniref:tRNA(Ile)-lysidine synthase n=1 Tax=Streptobacillus moniliformis (strain ATCC 14647 / DSM 12112 / NCTC 10651 / 9901) TaxID=519441 RepID=D1AXT3_STRM9|nr:tRNA lysidine(34) synthetase TilS [Streptobacillus moniliformis]ACZ01109.1 tRNA(Ile)-lysidine synthetase [Streptobacillus moniliformis DSM 12112]AVL42525.1 tRNA lysidine(34) synthetase TilS [Streptobacillus moniliformis]SQA13749.1 tRNA(Ile)-lysidine synthase [Streptobacillus moniliformis]
MFRNFIERNKLIEKNDKILIAFSAGPDSVFLLEKLLEIKDEYNLQLHLGYVNHNFRDDVHKDMELVKKIANKYNLEYSILDIKLEKFTEEKARELRYSALSDLKKRIKFTKIATGHNKTDNAETIIFRIIRGTGLDGLEGIRIKRDDIIRPILYISKDEILKQVYNEYVIDKTNLENNYSRNKIRNLVFPILAEINSKYIDNIVKIHKNIININDEKYEYILNKLNEKNISLNTKKIEQIYNILDKNESKIIDLGNEYIWYKSYDNNKILKKIELEKKPTNTVLTLNNEVEFNGFKVGYVASTRLEKISNKMYNILSLDTFDEHSTFIIRTRIDGDRLDNKKLKKLFIDQKIDKLERDKMPIVLYGNSVILAGDSFKTRKKGSINKYYLYIRRNYGR